jgi:hypothetical protein
MGGASIENRDFYILQMKDFENSVIKNLQEMRNETNFYDVTLACDEHDSAIRAHRIILSAASPYFKSFLSRSPNNHHTVIVSRNNQHTVIVSPEIHHTTTVNPIIVTQ